jgi:dihydroorotase
MTICIHGGKLVDPLNNKITESDIYIDRGIIAAIGEAPEGFSIDHKIDATGRLVVPGLIDCQARLRDPGQPHKANISSETSAAVQNGITSICIPPDTSPVIDNSATVELIYHRNANYGQGTRIYPIGALTRELKGEKLSNLVSLKGNGCIAFSNAVEPLASNLVQRRAMDYAAGEDMLIVIHPVDLELLGNGCAHEGAIATRLGLPAIPEAAETAALAKDIELVAQTGVRTHFGQLSCARSVDMIRRAKQKGLPVSADCAIHHLFLTDHDIGHFDSSKLTLPPLRSTYDKQALRDGVADGTIDCICSDHQPHEADAKLQPFPSAEPGISGLDTLLALALRLVEEKVISLPEAFARLSLNPARIFELPGGLIAEGEVADLAIIDTEPHWICRGKSFVSQGKNTAFEGWDFNARVMTTIIDGKIIFQR